MRNELLREANERQQRLSPEEISAIIQANEALYNLIKTGVVYGNVAVWATHLINYLTKLQNKKDDRFDKTLEKLKSDKPN